MNKTYYSSYKKYKNQYLALKHSQNGGMYETSKEYGIAKSVEFEDLVKHYETKGGNNISYYSKPFGYVKKEEFTSDMRKPDKNKVLLINSDFLFDIFTNKYGGITPYYNQYLEYPEINTHSIYINWDEVAHDFKGVYLEYTDTKLKLLRRSYASYKKIRLPSWWAREYERFGTGVIIFK